MSRSGCSSMARPFSMKFARGLLCVAMIGLDGFARAQDAPNPGTPDQTTETAEEKKQRELFQSIEWAQGPGTATLGAIARLRVSRGYVFTGPEGGKTFLEMCGTPAPKALLGILAPADSLDWFIIFELKPAVAQRDGTAKIDADALLRALRQEDDELNAIRRTRGWRECKGMEWETPPAYEGSRRDLTWTSKFHDGDQQGFNCTTRIFGRQGTIEANLCVDEKDLARVRSTFRNILSLVEFNDELSDDDSDLDDGAASGGSSASGAGNSRYSSRLLRPRSVRLIGGVLFVVISGVIGAYRKLRGA